jgi:predicted Zn-dependent protease
MAQLSRRQQLEQLLAEDPKDSFLRYALAMELVAAGDLAPAIDKLQEVLRDDPSYVAAYQQCGQLLIQLGRPVEARPVLEAGLAAAQKCQNVHAMEEIQGLLLNLGTMPI